LNGTLDPNVPMGARAGHANLEGKDYQRGLFLTITAGAAINRSHASDTIGTIAWAGGTIPDYQFPIDLSWEFDIWGNIRRTVEAAQANAQASATDLEAALLSARAALARNYFQLSTLDSQKRLYA
jgi:outer membrane protein TolC